MHECIVEQAKIARYMCVGRVCADPSGTNEIITQGESIHDRQKLLEFAVNGVNVPRPTGAVKSTRY